MTLTDILRDTEGERGCEVNTIRWVSPQERLEVDAPVVDILSEIATDTLRIGTAKAQGEPKNMEQLKSL